MPASPRAAPSLETVHVRHRATLLRRLTAMIEADERFVAAWLTGSFGRGEADAYSDVDCTVVVAAAHAAALCARPWRSAGHTTPERLALLSALGASAVVLAHDAHVNAPAGGTHTNVLYADGTRLDLVLVPVDGAVRPHQSRLLFQRVPVPNEPPAAAESLEERQRAAGQTLALFWIMAVGAAKYRRRGWDVAVQSMLIALREHVERIRRLVAGAPPRFERIAPKMTLSATPAAQADALRALCDEMEHLMPEVRRLGGPVPLAPRTQVERWLADRRAV